MFSSSSRSIFGLTNKFLNCLYRAFFTRKNFHGYSWWSLTGKSRKEETKNYVEFISGLKYVAVIAYEVVKKMFIYKVVANER